MRVLRTDAREFVIHRLAAQSLSAIHIYHPDPWPKKRHHKRRLIRSDFVNAAAEALEPGGRLAIQTDHAEYFEAIRGVTGSHPLLREVPFEDADYGAAEERTETNYEIKYMREGRPIYRIAFRREGAA